MVVVGVIVGATETRATALVGYSVTVFTSSENCLARPGEDRETFNKVYYLSGSLRSQTAEWSTLIGPDCRDTVL